MNVTPIVSGFPMHFPNDLSKDTTVPTKKHTIGCPGKWRSEHQLLKTQTLLWVQSEPCLRYQDCDDSSAKVTFEKNSGDMRSFGKFQVFEWCCET